VVPFSFLKSTQILNFSLILHTIIMGDNQVVSTIGLIKLVINILSMSCLTIAT
jgi:hypothetical protein